MRGQILRWECSQILLRNNIVLGRRRPISDGYLGVARTNYGLRKDKWFILYRHRIAICYRHEVFKLMMIGASHANHLTTVL